MKTVKTTRERLENLHKAAEHNGKLDPETMDRALRRIVKAARQIDREVDSLLAKARK